MRQEIAEIIYWIKMHIWVLSDDKEGFVKWKQAEDLLDSIPKMINCDNCKHRLVNARWDMMELDGEDCEPCYSCKERDKWEAEE